jgi:FkbM family methyltransferase
MFDLDTRQEIDWCLLFYGDYEPHMRQMFNSLLEAGAVAVDVGANIGVHTLTLANLVGDSGHVIAVEPNPTVRERLERNLQINEITNVVVYECALGANDDQMSLRIPTAKSKESANPGLASLVALDTPHNLVAVEVRRLDDLFNESGLERLDLVKIDVQGFEMQVLEGMTALIEKFRPAILFEYEDWAWQKGGGSLSSAQEFFKRKDYELYRVDAAARLKSDSDGTGFAGCTHVELIAVHKHDARAVMLRS